MTQGRGFSLVELILSVALLAFLLGMAGPPFQAMLARNRLVTSTNQFLSHVQMARSRAIMENSTVVICPTLDSATCATGNQDWSRGWLIFKDGDYTRPPHLDPEDTLLLVHQNNNYAGFIRTSLTHIRYSPAGNASNGTIILCGDRDSRYARAIIINIVGRARVSRTDANGAALDCS